MKNTDAAERLSAAVETRRAIRKAADAQRRGNNAMAYRLLEPEVRAAPDDARVVAAFWGAALACERAEDAVPAMRQVIRKLAVGGKAERAAELWRELRGGAPAALLDPGTLVRIVPALEADGTPDQVIAALRETVDSRNSGLSPGLAVRVAELARELDPPTALCAARRALASSDLDVAKRARVEALASELVAAEADRPPETADARPERGGATEIAVSAVVAKRVPAARFIDIKGRNKWAIRTIGLDKFRGTRIRRHNKRRP